MSSAYNSTDKKSEDNCAKLAAALLKQYGLDINHLYKASVRAQVKRLARKEYTKYLPEGYNRLNFAIPAPPATGTAP